MSVQTGVPAGMPTWIEPDAPLAWNRPSRAVSIIRSPLPVITDTSVVASRNRTSPDPVLTTAGPRLRPISTSPEPVDTATAAWASPIRTSPEPDLTWTSS